MYHFSAYECLIRSNIDLPGFAKFCNGNTDVLVRLGAPVPQAETDCVAPVSIHSFPDGLIINWCGVASYKITHGREVVIIPRSDSLSEEFLIQPIYGMAFAAVLHQQKHLILHGSTVAINGKALVLLGNKGFGKSTLTAFLLSNGHQFICDDVTALKTVPSEGPQVLPGIPRLRLRADTVDAIGVAPDTLPLAPIVSKHILKVQSNDFTTTPTPLQTILLLDHGDNIALHEMTESEKMLCLLGGQYFAKYHSATHHREHKRIFRQCEILAKSTNIVRLTAPRDLRLVPKTVQMLEQHMR